MIAQRLLDSAVVVEEPSTRQTWVVELPLGGAVHDLGRVMSLVVSPGGDRLAYTQRPPTFREPAPVVVAPVASPIDGSVITEGATSWPGSRNDGSTRRRAGSAAAVEGCGAWRGVQLVYAPDLRRRSALGRWSVLSAVCCPRYCPSTPREATSAGERRIPGNTSAVRIAPSFR